MDILGSLIFGFFEGNSVNPTWLRASRDGRLDLMIELERPGARSTHSDKPQEEPT